MLITEMERISLLLKRSAGSALSLSEIIDEEIKEFVGSPQFQRMAEAEAYYRNRSDVQRKTNDIEGRSNTKIEHPLLKRIIDQKANYMLSRPFTVSAQNKEYAAALNEVFDDAFRRKVKSLAKGAVKSGIAWLQPYFSEDGRLKFMRIPATEVIPIWKDAEKTELDTFIRFYDQIVYQGRARAVVTRVEYWSPDGVKRFVKGPGYSATLIPDVEYGEFSAHFTVNGKEYNWETAPIVWLKYNEEELPLVYFIKELIDDINWQTSVTADALRDVAKFIYVLKNYGGEDLAEFVTDLKKYLAIKVEGDGGVDKLQAELNIDAVMKFLDKQRRDVYDFSAAVDTKDPGLGSASGTAINFRYMDLDADCSALAAELRDTFFRLKTFIDAYLQLTGRGDFSKETFGIVFNMDMPVNETDVIGNVKNSGGILSQKTMLENHPWVTDVEAEIRQIDEEKRKAAEGGLVTGAGRAQAVPDEEKKDSSPRAE